MPWWASWGPQFPHLPSRCLGSQAAARPWPQSCSPVGCLPAGWLRSPEAVISGRTPGPQGQYWGRPPLGTRNTLVVGCRSLADAGQDTVPQKPTSTLGTPPLLLGQSQPVYLLRTGARSPQMCAVTGCCLLTLVHASLAAQLRLWVWWGWGGRILCPAFGNPQTDHIISGSTVKTWELRVSGC